MTQTQLISRLTTDVCENIQFIASDDYYWSPKDQAVYYNAQDTAPEGLWTLLHEVSHGLLGHANYKSDFELVLLEVEAWDHATELASNLKLTITDNYIQDCLDSYRDWQYRRSLCPHCTLGGIQILPHSYTCIFCHKNWQVSTTRFCRPYRKSK